MSKKAFLALEDGSIHQGYSFGAEADAFGEVVFCTSMVGYQEMLTDPSYAGQILVPTYPLIGNYGVNEQDFESAKIQVRGFVVREQCLKPSHHMSQKTIHQYLAQSGISGIHGVDTRAITRRLRSAGVMMGMITSNKTPQQAIEEVKKMPRYGSIDFVKEVTTQAPYQWLPEGSAPIYHIVILDCGLKYNILRILNRLGCRVTAVPCTTSAAEILSLEPDGILLSPGPGDPNLLDYIVATVKQLIGKKPIMGICLGNQLIARSFGAKTFKLKFGHRGGNHPVRELASGRIHITAQNHGYAVDPDTLRDGLEVTHINLNDDTVEGLKHKELPIFAIQYHPEASPGPRDNTYLFDKFLEMVEASKYIWKSSCTLSLLNDNRSYILKPSKVLIIGSGPIVIGQAAEFDYAGTQACKAMREEGIISVLVNSNPATIMTDKGIADIVYIEPLTVDTLARIIEVERPDGLLPTLGGQTGLNLAVELADAGILDKYNVRSLGTPIQTIRKAEDRELFKQLLIDIGEPVPSSVSVHTVEQAREVAKEIGLPLIIRPSYTLGGTGSGMANNWEELETAVTRGLATSPIQQVLLEESVVGWKEIEYEVMRDGADNCITVCNMENFDPMGVHTGDSIVVAPSQTLTNKEYQMLRTASLKIIRALGIEGGCNIQFALDPESDKYYVIEVNPRVSRSSALASKATGYPIARVAAKIAVGKRLDQIQNQITGKTMASFEPALDYVVVKIPHWPFDKFAYSNRAIGTQMKATGEVMAIDRCFEAALQKAVRSLESNKSSLLWEDPRWKLATDINSYPLEPNDLRLWAIMAALRGGITPEAITAHTKIDVWFTNKLQNIVDMEQTLRSQSLTPELLLQAKRLGFSDEQIGSLTDRLHEHVRKLRRSWNVKPVYKIVDTCAAEFDASTPYFYSTYEQEDEAQPLERKKAIVIGSGPIRIGQGIEFDYCCVLAAFALRDEGYETIMINCNPETVSTDYDTSDKLYFEPLTVEDVLSVYEKEKPIGVIVQFGGQTPLNIAAELEKAGVTILGTSVNSIDIASDRGRFSQMMKKYGIPMPESGTASNLDEALVVAERIGYPLILRPSYVLGGRGMEIIHDEEELRLYVSAAVVVTPDRPILIDRYLENAIETEADALADGEDVFIPAIMEHIEYAGVHSGDAACVIPPVSIPQKHIDTIEEYTRRIASELNVVGVMNIQYAICQDVVYVLEANPRASRTVPLVSKVCSIPMARLATQLILGKKVKDLNLKKQTIPYFGVKESVFPFNMFPEVDPVLGPEMKSTGEVLGIANSFGLAFWKAEEAVTPLPTGGTVLITVSERDRPAVREVARQFANLGFKIKATAGTHAFLVGQGIPSQHILKEHEGRPNITDAIKNREIQLVINTPAGKQSKYDDSYIRKAAVRHRVPYITTLAAAMAAAKGITAYREGKSDPKSLQSYHADIK